MTHAPERRVRILVAVFALTFATLCLSFLATFFLWRYFQFVEVRFLVSPLAVLIWFGATALAGAAFYLETGVSPFRIILNWIRQLLLPHIWRRARALDDVITAELVESTPEAPRALESKAGTHPVDEESPAVSAQALDPASTIARLRDELQAIGRRANLNLLIGIAITITGMTALFVYVWNLGTPARDVTLREIGAYFVPRASLVALIEVFAYFFLRLYRGNLAEIKYYQNELTNFESRILALQFSMLMQDKPAARQALGALAKTERNHILKKGESTVELERARLERDELTDLAREGIAAVAGARQLRSSVRKPNASPASGSA